MKLSSLQEKIVKTEYDRVIVVAAAASGKTAVLTKRLKYLLERGVSPKKIVAITFTNAAAEEMRSRVVNCEEVFIGTIHAYANYLLLCAGIDTDKTIDEEKFDELFEMVSKTPQCIKEVDYLLLDEAQDTTTLQFEFIFDMIKPRSYFLVGDYRQCLYSWKPDPARPDLFLRLSKDPTNKTYYLSENYRNAETILNFARGIIRKLGSNYIDSSIAMRHDRGYVQQESFSLAAIMKMLQKQTNFKNWFFLCRTNQQIDMIGEMLAKNEIPFDSFKKSQLTVAELNKKLTENTLKLLTIHTAKGLEADNVIVYGTKWNTPDEIKVNYVAATRARDRLIWINAIKKRQI